MTTIEVFFLLQVLDFMTTLVGLRMGGSEMMPFARWLIQMDPIAGLTAVKLVGFFLGGICLYLRRPRVLIWVNYIFAGIVLWNVGNIMRAVDVSLLAAAR